MSDVGNFELKSIRRELREDLRRYRREIAEALEKVADDHEYEKHFDDVNRCAHAVRGVSSLVGAWALVFWCEDVEKLARYAIEKHARDPERINMIVQFLQQNHDAFEQLGNRVLNNDLDGALDLYSETRSEMPLELREITTERDKKSMEYASGKRTARFQHEARRKQGTRRFRDVLPDRPHAISNLPPVPGAAELKESPSSSPGSAAGPGQGQGNKPARPAPGFQQPYLTEARFFLGRVEHILGTEVMPAKTADLWRILARLISSLEYYLLALGNAGMLQLVDRMQQLTLRTIEDENLRTEETVERLKEDRDAIEKELDEFPVEEQAGSSGNRTATRRGEHGSSGGIVPPVPGSVPTDDGAVHHLAAGNRLSNLRMLTNRFQQSKARRGDQSKPRVAQHAVPQGEPPPRNEPRIESSHPQQDAGNRRRTTRVARIPLTREHTSQRERRPKTEQPSSQPARTSSDAGAAAQSAAAEGGQSQGTSSGRTPRALRHRQILAEGIKMPLSRLVPPAIPLKKEDEPEPEWEEKGSSRGIVELKTQAAPEPEPEPESSIEIEPEAEADTESEAQVEPEAVGEQEGAETETQQELDLPDNSAAEIQSEPQIAPESEIAPEPEQQEQEQDREENQIATSESEHEPEPVAESPSEDAELIGEAPPADALPEPGELNLVGFSQAPAPGEEPQTALPEELEPHANRPVFRPFMPLPPVWQSPRGLQITPEPEVELQSDPDAEGTPPPDQPSAQDLSQDLIAVPEESASSLDEPIADLPAPDLSDEQAEIATEPQAGLPAWLNETVAQPGPESLEQAELGLTQPAPEPPGNFLPLPRFLPRIPFPPAHNPLPQPAADEEAAPAEQKSESETEPTLEAEASDVSPKDLPELPPFALRMPFPIPQSPLQKSEPAPEEAAVEESTDDPVRDAIQTLLSPSEESDAEPAEPQAATELDPGSQPQAEEPAQAVPAQVLEADAELAQIFVPEARELLDNTEAELLAWERDDQQPGDHRQALRRHLHTLKGAAASIGLQLFADDVHILEDFVMSTAEDAAPPSRQIGELLKCVDTSREFLAQLESTGRAEWGVDWKHLFDPSQSQEEPGAEQEKEPQPDLERVEEPPVEDQTQPTGWAWTSFRPRFTWKSVDDLKSVPQVSPASQVPSGALHLLTDKSPADTELTDAGDDVGEVTPSEADSAILGAEDKGSETAAEEPSAAESPAPAAAASAAASGGERAHIWVDAQRMRNLLNNIGELIIDRNRFGKNLSTMNSLRSELKQNRARLSDAIAQFRREFEYTNVGKKSQTAPGNAEDPETADASSANGGENGNGGSKSNAAGLGFDEAFRDFSDIEFDRYDEFNVLARVLEEIVDDIDEIGRSIENATQRLSDNNAEFSKTSRQLQHELSSLNMMPAHSLFRRLERVFRTALEDTGKLASIHFEGEETMIDRAMLDQLYAPLMHLVRNCVAHGIEPREERLQLDKPLSGRVEVKAYNLSNQVVIEVSDDGAGIREEAVRERGIRDGKLPEDAGELPREQILDLLFSSGFSTQQEVTSLAGRGVGLEVVKREVENLNGALRLVYEPGQFCRWTIQLPLTVSATEAAMVEAGDRRFAIPLSFVEGGLLLDDQHLAQEDGQESYRMDDGQLVPLRNLATLLDLDRPGPPATQALMLNTGGFRVALRIERLVGREEIVVKSLGNLLGEHPFYSGATLDEEGRPLLILNAPNLATFIRSGESLEDFAGIMHRRTQAARDIRATDPAGSSPEVHVLVVDDSLSVRKSLERNLQQIGCEVSLAADGADALEQMRTRLFDLILTDLEMPRMDGFQLITETRDLDMWSGVPIYVVTSRVTEKYRRRAEQLGANGFLSKPVRIEDLQKILEEKSSLHR